MQESMFNRQVYLDYVRTQQHPLTYKEIVDIMRVITDDELSKLVDLLQLKWNIKPIIEKTSSIYHSIWCFTCQEPKPIKQISSKYIQCSGCYDVTLYKLNNCHRECQRNTCMVVLNSSGGLKCACGAYYITLDDCSEMDNKNYHIKNSKKTKKTTCSIC